MTFTPEIWKNQVSERLGNFGDWLKKRGEREVPNLIYGGLCGMTLWPLVLAAQSGLSMSVGMALGSIVGGVGGNLIANQLEKWKERADEVDVHEWAAEQAPKNPVLRDALDAIMENFDVIARAEAELDEEDRAWFSETLKKELQQLGNLTNCSRLWIGRHTMIGYMKRSLFKHNSLPVVQWFGEPHQRFLLILLPFF